MLFTPQNLQFTNLLGTSRTKTKYLRLLSGLFESWLGYFFLLLAAGVDKYSTRGNSWTSHWLRRWLCRTTQGWSSRTGWKSYCLWRKVNQTMQATLFSNCTMPLTTKMPNLFTKGSSIRLIWWLRTTTLVSWYGRNTTGRSNWPLSVWFRLGSKVTWS